MKLSTPIPANCTHFKIRRLMRAVSKGYDRELAKVGLVTTQFSLLTVIALRGPLPLGVLATRVGLNASTLTRNLKPLLKAGWVQLETAGDARRRIARITIEGAAMQTAAEPYWRTAQLELDAMLGPILNEGLHEVLDAALNKLLTID
ncbi:MAG: MarR family transcriptional regulator [Proteobacteria bacterium]|nr:MarR family transcriptional regulator [Pseudomonadota bacterium]